MKNLFFLLLLLTFTQGIYAQHTHGKEAGLKGKIKKITCIYYQDGVMINNSWTPGDSAKFTYKTISYYNASQNIDSITTFLSHGGKERLATRKGYVYLKNREVNGWEYDYINDISYTLSIEWLDKTTYMETAKDPAGNNWTTSKIYMDEKFQVIKKEDQLHREGETFDLSTTETRFKTDNTEHTISITENKASNLESSLDEYVDQRDKNGNPIKKTYHDKVNNSRSIKYFTIEYYE
jgi:hypothetical protein